MTVLHRPRQTESEANTARRPWIWLICAGFAVLWACWLAFVFFAEAAPNSASSAVAQAPAGAQNAELPASSKGEAAAGQAGARAPASVAEPPTETPEPTAQPTATPEPTATSQPTATPQPTATSEPTATPEPTAVPTPELPPPLVIEGEGTTITGPITFPSPINLAVISYEGGDAFSVTWVEPDGADEVLTSGGGPYSGQHLVSGYGEHTFNVTASGRWTIRLEPLAHCEDPAPSPAP